MGTEEMLSIIDALKAAGATHFKCRDFAVRLGRSGVGKAVKKPLSQRIAGDVAPPPPPPEYNAENTAKAESLLDLIKGKDEQLLDVIFPDGAGG
jgi:hypothetical protein